jgi:hypothetical protein
METNTMAQVKHVRKWVRNVPAECETRLYIEMLVTGEQVIEEKIVNALGIRVNSDAWIEVRRAALDDHDDFIGSRLL